MRVSQIVTLCNILGDLELPNRYELAANSEILQDENVQKLIVCCNNVMQELCCDYAAIVKSCVVEAKNGFIDTESLQLNRVLSLKDNSNNNAPYRYTKGGLFAADGEYLLTYARLPEKIFWDDELTMPDPRITDRLFAYGVLFEYFLATGEFEKSKLWEIRYRDALQALCGKKSPMNLPVGRWC